MDHKIDASRGSRFEQIFDVSKNRLDHTIAIQPLVLFYWRRWDSLRLTRSSATALLLELLFFLFFQADSFSESTGVWCDLLRQFILIATR